MLIQCQVTLDRPHGRMVDQTFGWGWGGGGGRWGGGGGGGGAGGGGGPQGAGGGGGGGRGERGGKGGGGGKADLLPQLTSMIVPDSHATTLHKPAVNNLARAMREQIDRVEIASPAGRR